MGVPQNCTHVQYSSKCTQLFSSLDLITTDEICCVLFYTSLLFIETHKIEEKVFGIL